MIRHSPGLGSGTIIRRKIVRRQLFARDNCSQENWPQGNGLLKLFSENCSQKLRLKNCSQIFLRKSEIVLYLWNNSLHRPPQVEVCPRPTTFQMSRLLYQLVHMQGLLNATYKKQNRHLLHIAPWKMCLLHWQKWKLPPWISVNGNSASRTFMTAFSKSISMVFGANPAFILLG